jgi:hypothetical protein
MYIRKYSLWYVFKKMLEEIMNGYMPFETSSVMSFYCNRFIVVIIIVTILPGVGPCDLFHFRVIAAVLN